MLKYKIRLAVILTSLLSISISHAKQQAIPFPDTEFTTVDTCKSCHGHNGLGVPNFTPMLAGLSKEYLEQQIKLYQTVSRVNVMMTPMSQKVEDPKLRHEILNYFANLPAPKITNLEQRGDHVIIEDSTKKLVYQGDWSRNIPACASCHGPSGAGIASFPRLANQHAAYIEEQLTMWQKDLRRGDHDNVMGNIAKKLTPEEISKLAQYFSTIK